MFYVKALCCYTVLWPFLVLQSSLGKIRLVTLFFSFCVMAFIVPCLPHTVLWEKAGLLALLCVVISCVFVTFSMRVLIRFRTKSEVGTVKPSSISFTDRSFFVDSFCYLCLKFYFIIQTCLLRYL